MFSVIFVIVTMSLTSCQNESYENAVNKNTTSKDIRNLIVKLSENNIKIDNALAENNNLIFDENVIKFLNAAKNETDIKKSFETAGIKNSDELINLLKEKVNLGKQFMLENPNFYKLDLQKRTILLDKVLDSMFFPNYVESKINKLGKLSINDKNTIASKNCAKQYNININRCNGSSLRCSAAAIISASAGIWPGLIGAAFCMWESHDCKIEASEDYRDCLVETRLSYWRP